MGYGEPLDTNIPAVGAAGTQYATDINERLAEVEAVLESKVPFSALEGDELDLQNVPVVDASYISFVNNGLPDASPVGRLQMHQNNLYWITDEGLVRITNNGALDVSSIGGIGGDYGAGNELVTYAAGTSMYNFYSNESTVTWGYVRARGVDIADGAATTDVVRLRAPAISASYDFIFPAFLPASGTSVLTLDSTGQVANAGTVSFPITNNTYSTGQFYHGDRVRITAMDNGDYNTSKFIRSNTPGNDFGIQYQTAGAGQTTHAKNCIFNTGERLKSVIFRLNKTGTTSTTITVYKYSVVSGTSTSLGSQSSTTSGRQAITITLGTPEVIGNDEAIYVNWAPGDNLEFAGTIECTYDYPG